MEQLTPLLKELADKLGTTAEFLFETMIKQASIEASFEYWGWIISLVFAILFLTSTIGLFIQGVRDDYDSGVWFFWCSISVLGVVVMGFAARSFLLGYYTCVYNPEYWALKEILNSLSK